MCTQLKSRLTPKEVLEKGFKRDKDKKKKWRRKRKKIKGHIQLLQDQRDHIHERHSERKLVNILLNFFSSETKIFLVLNKILVSGEIYVTPIHGLLYATNDRGDGKDKKRALRSTCYKRRDG